MRILHVITRFDPTAGGPPMVASRLAAAQAGLGHEVHAFAYRWPGTGEAVEALFASIPHGRAVVRHEMEPPSRFERLCARGARRLCVPLVERADVLHLHSVWVPLLPTVAAAARRLGVPYAHATHGNLNAWSLSQKRLKKRIALALVYQRMLDRAAFLHVLNDDESRYVERIGVRAPRVVLPNGVFLEEFSPVVPEGTLRRVAPALANRRYVLFVGRLHHSKGLDHLIDAFAAIAPRREVDLVVVGPDVSYGTELRARIAHHGLDRRVHVVGARYGDEKLALLRGASCFCLPSRQEGFSIAITEAMACGVPVVISEGCHFPEVEAREAGLVVPLETAAIAEALARVLDDEALGSRMGAAGRSLVEERYTWPRIAERAIEAYRTYAGV